MEFEPILEKIECPLKKKNFFDQIKVDCKGEVETQNISSVLNVSSWVFISESRVEDNQIHYGGKVNFYIAYIDVDNKLCKSECAVEFKGSIKDQTLCDCDKFYIDAVVEKCNYDLSGATILIDGYISVKAEVVGVLSKSVVVGGENFVVDEKEFAFIKTSGIKKATYPLEEEFTLSYPVQEVLNHSAKGIITAVQCGVGCIIVDGEVLLSAIMLQKNDKGGIIKETNAIPYRMEIECEECMPSMQAIARVKERSFKVDVTVDEEKNQSIMRASVNLAFQGEAFYFESVNIANDLFSTRKEVELSRTVLDYAQVKEMKNCSLNLSVRVGVNQLPASSMLLAITNENCEIIKIEQGSPTKITGSVFAKAIMRDGDDKIFTTLLEAPFESQVDFSFENNEDLTVVANIKSCKARIVSLTECELDCELFVNFYPEEKNQIKVIDEIKILGDKVLPTSAISVYIPTCGEELWSLAKRLNESPERLIETNPELQFPLEGDERIVIYRQK